MIVMLFLILFHLINCVISLDKSPDKHSAVVVTSKGKIKGLHSENGDYVMFLGVPYAVVNENNPFGNATLHPGFNSTFEAYNGTAVCPQYKNTAIGTIHCLHLNIYVPKSNHSHKTIPVMVFLHGGAFAFGDGYNFDPKFLVRHNVIVITMNYRLGPFGFLCLSIPGYNNQGMRDQVLAFKWIKQNIKSFKGDVNKITVFGHSAGAITLDLQILSLKDKLFNRAILQSGTAISPWITPKRNDNIILSVAKYFGFADKNVENALIFLSNRDPLDIINAANDLQVVISNGLSFTIPCLEKDVDNTTTIEYASNLQPEVGDLDIMIGTVDKEVMFIYPETNATFYEEFHFADEIIKEFTVVENEEIVKRFYVGDGKLSEALESKILDFGSDFAFHYPAERTVNGYLDNHARKVYRYIFSYDGGRNMQKVEMNLTSAGAAHGDELGYLFDINSLTGQPSADDQKMIDIMTELWTNFAKYGNPTRNRSELIPHKWPPVKKDKHPFMLIDLPLTVKCRPYHKRMAFLDLYYELNKNKLRGFVHN